MYQLQQRIPLIEIWMHRWVPICPMWFLCQIFVFHKIELPLFWFLWIKIWSKIPKGWVVQKSRKRFPCVLLSSYVVEVLAKQQGVKSGIKSISDEGSKNPMQKIINPKLWVFSSIRTKSQSTGRKEFLIKSLIENFARWAQELQLQALPKGCFVMSERGLPSQLHS